MDSSYHTNKETSNDQINLINVIDLIWNKKLLISLVSIISLLSTFMISLLFSNIYKSEAILAPVYDNDSNMDLLERYSGLANLAGISVPSDSDDKSAEAIERIVSHDFFVNFFLPNILLQNLMATKNWNDLDNTITYKKRHFDDKKSIWVRKVRPPKSIIPSSQEAYKEYKDILSISQDRRTSFVTISMTHESPNVAKKWVDIIINEINKSMRDEERQKVTRSIEFLENEFQKVQYSEIKEAITLLQQREMKSLMLIESNEDFIFKILSSPVAAEKKISPNRIIISIGVTVFIFITMIITLVFKDFYRNQLSVKKD